MDRKIEPCFGGFNCILVTFLLGCAATVYCENGVLPPRYIFVL